MANSTFVPFELPLGFSPGPLTEVIQTRAKDRINRFCPIEKFRADPLKGVSEVVGRARQRPA